MFKKKNLKYLFTIMSLFLIALMIVFLVSPNLGKKTTQESLKQELIVNKGTYDESTIVLKDTNKSIATSLANRLNAKLRITKDGSFATLTLSDSTFLDVVSNPDNKDILDYFSVDYMSTVSDIEEVEEEYVKKPSKYIPSDEYYNAQSYLDYINLDNVWSSYRGWGVTVAIIDTGIDTDHPEFEGRISEYSYNATLDKIVKDYTDSEGNYDWSLIEDTQGHGTAVTGVIAAAMDNGGIAGISPNVTILTIKVESDEYGNFYRTSDLVFGLYYAIERDVNVVNMSFGGGTNPYSDAARLAVDSDITLVAAAGNDATSSLTYPAADPNVIGVGALAEKSFELAQYSNYGENNDLVAPGTVYTTKNDGTYTTMNGTSFASPIVASVVALYNNYEYYPTVDAIKERLFASTIDLGALGKDYYYGYGALDVKAFILEPVSTVTFNYLTDEIDETKQIFINGHTLQSLPEPERLYSVFDGWYYDIDCTEELKYYEDIFSSDLTLYAKWANEDDSVPYTYVTLDDNTVEIRSYTGHRRYITIPDYIDGKVVSSIGDEAFSNETRIREINLPRYLTNISRNAFYGCSNLLKINIPDTVTSIGNNAFKDCVRMQEVIFGEASILKQIGSYAFSNCSSLLRFDIPKSVETVDGATFMGTTSLREINAHKQSKVYKSVDGVLFNKTKSTLIAYPAGLKQGYLIPSSVTKLGVASFAYTKEETINLNNIKTIEDYAFSSSKLISIVIPDSVTYMGMGAFNLSTNLKTVTLSKNLNTISSYAFNSCYSLSEILIPNNIITIESSAFGMSGLVNITFEENSKLLSIGEASFEKTLLNKIIIPKSVVQIGDSAFNYNVYLTSVLFEEGSSLYSIGSNAFNKNVNLTTINLPNNLGYIGSYAFMESKLTGSITLPASVEAIGDGAFASCHSLEYIFVDEENIVYKDINGVLYTVDNTMLVAYPSGNTSYNYIVENVKVIGAASFYGAKYLGEVILPNTLEEIREYAFAYNTNLGYITIPQNVVQIGRFAFTNNYNLTSVYFDQNSVLPRISYASFANTGLQSITIPSSVSTIAQEAFIGSNNLTNVTFEENSNLDIISAYMFKGSNNIQSITFLNGSKLKSISAHGFEGMRNLQTVDFGDATVENIDNYAFRYCSSLSNIVIPSTVKYIGRYAFYGAKSLTRLDIPESVDYIGTNAFYMADNLDIYFKKNTLPTNLQYNWDNGIRGYYVGVKKVLENEEFRYAILNDNTISIIEYLGSNTSLDLTSISFDKDITQIGGYAFYRSNLTNVILPSTITMIGQYSFAYSKINSVTIPDNVKYIAKYAFYNSDITEVKISENSKLEKIEQHAFSLCDKLTNIYIPSSVKTLERGVFKESGLTNVTFDSNINITTIPEEAFLGTKLVTVSIPNSVTLIDHNAFRDILNLQSVKFGTSNLQIMSNVFYNTGLTVVNIPANITYIGEYSFVGLRELKEFNVDENNTKYKDIDGVLFSKDGKKLIAYPASITGAYTVNKNVETIGFGAFENTSLSSVTFEEGINLLTIGYRAFFNAKKLTEVSVPASVVSIDYYAFAYCENLIKVSFAKDNRLTGIYEGAFYGCKSLKDIVLPDSIIEISNYSFSGCISLETLPISKNSSLKGIYSYAFAHSGLKEITIPETVVDIESYAFKGVKITNLVIPSTNAKQLIIGIGAFEDCNYLETITLPFIGASYEDTNISWFGYVFGAGSYEANNTYVPESLKEVTIHEGITLIGYGAFYDLDKLEKINIPHSVNKIYRFAFVDCHAEYELTNEISFYVRNNERATTLDESFFGVTYDFNGNIKGTLKIADGLKQISHFALMGQEKIEKIVIPESVEEILLYAFANCTNLEEINIPKNITVIDQSVFLNCINLKKMPVHENIEEIRSGAFSNCDSLTEVIIPNKVTILESIFEGCDGLTEVLIPSHISSVEMAVFNGCKNLKTISFENGSKIDEIPNLFCSYCDSLENIVLPDTVTYIGEKAFEGCNSLKSIVIPNNVEKIDLMAFNGCNNLCEVIIDSNSALKEINDLAFCGTLLNEFSIPSNVEFIGDQAFGATKIFKIYNHSDLQIEFGSTLNGYIGYLAKVIVEKDGTIRTLNNEDYEIIITEDNFMFIRHDSEYVLVNYLGDSKNIALPSLINNCTYRIELAENKSIINLTIPKNINQINDYAFFRCYNLETVTFEENSQISIIEDYAFSECYKLKSINLPDSITEIYGCAFLGCRSLEAVTIPKNLLTLASDAFSNCPSLQEVNCTIEQLLQFGSIKDLSGQASINIEVNSEKYIYEDNCYFNEDKTILYYADKNIRGKYVVPESVTQIKEFAFANCNYITEMILPSALLSIEKGAFKNCINLQILEMNSDINYFPHIMVENCINLEIFRYNSTLENWLNTYMAGGDNNPLYYGADLYINGELLKELIIPEGVERIESYLFRNYKQLRKVEFSSTVQYIGFGSFSETSIVELVIPKNVIEVGNDAFFRCSNLTNVTIYSSDVELGAGIFGECTSLENVILPDGLKKLSIGLFAGCNNLTSITLPNSIEVFEQSCFSGCINLTEVKGDFELIEIGSWSFEGCKSLKEFEIKGDKIKYIESGAFNGCSSLTSFKVPEGITELGYIFGDCINLKELYLPSTLKSITGLVCNGATLSSLYYNGTVANWCNISIDTHDYWGATFLASPTTEVYFKNESNEYERLDSVKLPTNIEKISKYSFYSFDIKELIIPENITEIDDFAFGFMINLFKIVIENRNTEINISTNAFENSYAHIIYNNSDMDIIIGDSNYGNIALMAKVIYNKDGSVQKLIDDELIIETEDGYVYKQNGTEDISYTLIGYLGKENTITLPRDIFGKNYLINLNYSNAENIIIPEWFGEISSQAFTNLISLKTVYISKNVKSINDSAFNSCINLHTVTFEEDSELQYIGFAAFSGCESLTSIVIPDKVVWVHSSAFSACTKLEEIVLPSNIEFLGNYPFSNTAFSENEDNWENGLLILDGYLLAHYDGLDKCAIPSDIKVASSTIFENQTLLKFLEIPMSLADYYYVTYYNLETLVINNISENDNVIIQPNHTLKNIIIKNGVQILNNLYFSNLSNVNIYVDEYKENVMWDHDYPNWNNGNKVFYKGEWIISEFYDINNELIEEEYYSVNQIIRQPFVENINDGIYSYEFIGWDLNNDGVVDTIPATSTVDICAKAIYEKTINKYQVNFIDKDGTTILFSYEVDHGNIITLPDVPTKKGYTFISWEGYTEGMVAIEDINIYSTWLHNDSGHNYSVVETVDPTCEEQGYIKHICSICDEWYGTDFVEALGHNYVENIISPTCEEQGYTKHTCSVCDDTYNDNYVEKLNHSFGEWIIDQNATCEEDGLKHRICSSCDYNEESVIDAFGHNYVIERLSNSTCTNNGYDKYTCTNCNEEVILELPLESHNYVEKYASKTIIQILLEFVLNIFFGYKGDKAYYYECQVCKHILLNNEQSSSSVQGTCAHEICVWNEDVEASCDEVGFMLNTCTSCNEVINVKTIEALGHSYSSEVTLPTCTELGYTTHTCERCNETYVDTYVDSLGHSIVIDEKVEPTCTATGLTEGEHCTRCDYKVAQDIIEALGHNYTSVITSPTCLDKGYTTHTCNRCNDSYVDSYVDALGHNIVIDERVEPTCTETGLTEGEHCTRCDHKVEQTVIEALGHNYKSVVTLPTCTERGYTTHTCERCNATYVDTYVDALGHDIVVDERVEPTCTETGLTEGEHCTRCDYKVAQEVVEALGHNYNSVVTKPTCLEKGYTTHTCDRCNDSYIDNYVDALGHDIVVDEKVEPTCTETGLTEGEHCIRCDYKVVQEIINALGHNYNSVVIEPTCETQGYTAHTCERCNDSYVDSYVEASGHELIVDKGYDATCTEAGLTDGSHCAKCDYKVEQVKIDPKGHIESDWIIDKEATTESDGTKHKECTVCGDELIKGTINKLPSSNNCNMSKVYIMNLILMFNLFALAILIFRKRR